MRLRRIASSVFTSKTISSTSKRSIPKTTRSIARLGRRRHYFVDTSKSIIAENDSPDVPFTHSVNPYRGCSHGCVYCFARPTHEYLGFSAGLDFETKIMVKPDAAALLRRALSSPKWQPTRLAISGVTDCYQPIEKQLRLTRACLEVCHEFRQPREHHHQESSLTSRATSISSARWPSGTAPPSSSRSPRLMQTLSV